MKPSSLWRLEYIYYLPKRQAKSRQREGRTAAARLLIRALEAVLRTVL
jgi:hypothetical protein